MTEKHNPFSEDKHQIQELLKIYSNLKSGNGHSYLDEESFERIISHYQDKDDLKNAFEAAELATGQFPWCADLLIKKADILLAKRRYNEALAILDKAELLDSKDINLYICKTDAYLALEMEEEAISLLQNALTIFEGEERIELLFELGDVYDYYEDFDKVFESLKMILELEPNNEEALYKICFWTDFTGRNEEGITLHTNIIDNFPYNHLAWFNLGAAYQGIKLYEKAIDAYNYAIVIDEKFDYAYRNIGDAYIRLRKYKEAIEVLSKVVELAKPEDVILEAIGYCYDRLKNYSQARLYYRKAIHLNPSNTMLFYKMACTYFNDENYSSCSKQLEHALKINSHHPDFNLLMGECKLRSGLYEDAIDYFKIAVNARPKNAAGWEALIRCMYYANDFDNAYDNAVAALHFTSGKPVFLFYKSVALFGMGKNKEALLQLEEAMEKAPRLLKKFVDINPSILQNHQVVDMIAKYKRKKSI
jgi:tetratricopeptide (TPR) repeat protein